MQCESCSKWRSVPPHIVDEGLPDSWVCSMNTWEVAFAKCIVEEEVFVNNGGGGKKQAGGKSRTVNQNS